VGLFTRSSELGLRWKHSAFATYKVGDWGGTLRQQYSSGYAGYIPPGVANGTVSPPNYSPFVKAYTLYHANVAYTGIKNLTLIGGIKNLLNTDPPFALAYDTNTGAGSSWEPRVADPRGRSFVVSAEYKFF
jgi:iron complex outermembrane receptor protein